MFQGYCFSNSNQMDDCSISSQRHSRTWIGEVTYTRLSVSLLDCIFRQYDIEYVFACSSETDINIQIEWTVVVEALNDIFISG